MKRLVAKTPQTQNFNIDTKAEVEKIHNEDNRCVYNNLIYYEKSHDEGVSGGIYYELKDGMISIYVVEAFFFHDVDKSSSDEIDVMAYVATKLDKKGNPDTNSQFVLVEPNGTKDDEKSKTSITIAGHGLNKIDARDFNTALEKIKAEYTDFSEEKLA
jgi:hypothetical protein